MTLDAFVATRRWSDDIGTELDDLRWEGGPKAEGLIYVDTLYIEMVRGEWHLTIGNYTTIADLIILEHRLWLYAQSEEFI